MKTYNVNNIVNIPFMKGCFESVKNESRVNQALAVYNQIENLGIAFDAALYKKVARYFVNSDKAVMMAFAEYQAKNAEPAELDEIDKNLHLIAVDKVVSSRTQKMKYIFDYCVTRGITEPKEMRARCEKALNYHNTGRIWNTWKEWSVARTAAERAAKAAERKAKREAKAAAERVAKVAERRAKVEKDVAFLSSISTPHIIFGYCGVGTRS